MKKVVYFFWEKHNSVKEEKEKFNLKIFIKTLYGMALCEVEKEKEEKNR